MERHAHLQLHLQLREIGFRLLGQDIPQRVLPFHRMVNNVPYQWPEIYPADRGGEMIIIVNRSSRTTGHSTRDCRFGCVLSKHCRHPLVSPHPRPLSSPGRVERCRSVREEEIDTTTAAEGIFDHYLQGCNNIMCSTATDMRPDLKQANNQRERAGPGAKWVDWKLKSEIFCGRSSLGRWSTEFVTPCFTGFQSLPSRLTKTHFATYSTSLFVVGG